MLPYTIKETVFEKQTLYMLKEGKLLITTRQPAGAKDCTILFTWDVPWEKGPFTIRFG